MKEMRYGLAAVTIVVLLMVFTGGALADIACPPTETVAPPTERPPATVTPIPPTEVVEPTPTSPPPATYPPTDEPTPTDAPWWTPTSTRTGASPTPDQPMAEPTPTETVRPPGETGTPYPAPTETPGAGNHPKPSATWDCIKFPDNQEKCLAHTGGGLPPNMALGLTSVGIVVFLGIAFLARVGRRHAAG